MTTDEGQKQIDERLEEIESLMLYAVLHKDAGAYYDLREQRNDWLEARRTLGFPKCYVCGRLSKSFRYVHCEHSDAAHFWVLCSRCVSPGCSKARKRMASGGTSGC